MLINALRGHLGEFGIIGPAGRHGSATCKGLYRLPMLCLHSVWVRELLGRRPFRLVSLALDNKLARIAAWGPARRRFKAPIETGTG
jgi:hypothetical protein